MTASDYTIIIAAVSLGVVQALGICVQMITAWRASDKVEAVASTLEKVHIDTNGNLTALRERITTLEKLLLAKPAEGVQEGAQEVVVVNAPSQPVPTVAT